MEKITHAKRKEMKEALIKEIDQIRVAIKEKANKIPQDVLDGDAIRAAGWRDQAEKLFFREKIVAAHIEKSLNQLLELKARESVLLASLA